MDLLSISAILANPIFAWIKWIFFIAVGGGIIYAIYSYFEYNVIVEYNKLMGNGVIKEVTKKAKRWNDRGSVKYKIWRSKLVLKRTDDYSFITVKGRKEKIRILAVGDNTHYFLRLDAEKLKYEATPAEIEEWAVLTHEYYFKKYMEMKDKLGKALPWIGIGLGVVVFIVAMFFAVEMITASTGMAGSLLAKATEVLDKFVEKTATIPAEKLPT